MIFFNKLFTGKSDKKQVDEELKKLVLDSNFFDEEFYIKEYSSIDMDPYTPLEHYLNFGIHENLKPNDIFDPIWYLEYYEDLKDGDLNPTIHFIKFGKEEGRLPNNQFIKKEPLRKEPLRKEPLRKEPLRKEPTLVYITSPEYIIKDDKRTFMYLPWMPTHGDKLIKQLDISEKYNILPLKIIKDFDEEKRSLLSSFSRDNSDIYRRVLLKNLIPIKNQISGVLLTFDWHPVMRILAKVCKELNIKTYLVLHESVFLDINKYYWHEETNINIPICDHIITWGDLQKNIFVSRGVPESKIISLGTPKFDIYHEYRPLLTKEEFCNIYGLDSDKKIFLYALQPMDVQVDQKVGISKQREAVNNIMDYCEEHDIQFILREAPSSVNTLYSADRKRVEKNPNFFIDISRDYITTPEESIYHVDIVFSINSTMLFEALLLNTNAISTKYIEFEQIWNKIELPFATDKIALFDKISDILQKDTSEYIKWEWAYNNLSNGDFDGNSAKRIKDYLEHHLEIKNNIKSNKEYFDAIVDNIAISNTAILENSAKYLFKFLNAKHIITPKTTAAASSCDKYIQWGITLTDSKEKLRLLMKNFGQNPFIIEDGFIRSVEIGLSGEAGLSISLCGKTAYYDAYGISNFEQALNSDTIYNSAQINEAKIAIQNIMKNNISKYNDSPLLPIKIGDDEKSKVLVIDQRLGDQSVQAAMASEKDFQNMLIDAINENPKSDIIIKRHPDAVKGGKGSYYSDSKVKYTENLENVFLIDYDIHPHKLVQMCDKIYVVSSGLGFEALLYGKEVNCYGIPFYANWGVTNDKKKLDRRTKIRTVEEIFYVAYIEFSRYYSPALNRVCDINECIEYINEQKK